MVTTLKRLKGRTSNERGASLVEYALLVALIAVVCIVAVTFLGTSASNKLNRAGLAVEADPYDGWTCEDHPLIPNRHSLTSPDLSQSSGWLDGPCP